MTNAAFPLHDAARKGRSRVVMRLLELGHSASTLDEEGRRASQRAREAGHHDLADELESREAGHASVSSHSSIHEALTIKELVGLVQGKPGAVSALIAAGRVGAIDAKGDTPLHICASQGRLQFCDQLIKAGANPAAMNFEGKKPHDRAAENGHAMVAGLLRSLLPESFVAPDDVRPDLSTAVLPVSKPVKEATDDIFAFDDLDLDFDGEEEAEDFHRDLERDDYVASFDAVQGRVTRLGDEDGAELEFDDLRRGGFRIDAEDVVGPLPQTAEFADGATFRSYLDVRTGRKSAPHATAPTTRFHAISESALMAWVERVLAAGTCNGEDVDTLIGDIRGFFDAETVRGNLVHELTNLGLMPCEDESCEVFVAGHPSDPEDVADLLACICNGSNMRPGVEFKPLSARAEARLFRELSASQQDMCRALVSNETLVSVVVMLGEKVEAGSVPPSLLTDLDVQHGRQTPDGEVLSASLSCLVGYQTMLEDGAVTAEQRAYALSAVSALKLSRDAVDLIAQGLRANPELDDVRHRIEASLRARENFRREILLEHLALVRRQASRREAPVDDIEDMVHDGVFGLMRSIDLFEPDRGNRFMTYCQFGVRQSITRALDDTGSLVRVPSHRAIVLRKVDRLEEGISQQLSAEAIISVISEEMEIPPETIREIRRIPRRPVPFEEMVHDCLDVDSPQFRHVLARQRTEIIEHFLADMPERAADVIVRRFGLRGEDEMTLEELGAIHGVTRERIRQIEAKRLAEIGHRTNQRLLRNLI
ncbi:sigma-70 family RNA polymerase sigma factor [Rhodobacter capsulatus]|uniref:RNA polymerase sigma factor n=2 Tax=Rhodobacter capsulatus TaxID=1061 RepID=A0A4U1JL69_RHOCA|nr:sigma-70 family RNA polymerase sigma factor [Rhodobacter capsulatus]